MKPGKPVPDQDDLLHASLVEMIDMRHELVKLEALIDWDIFEREWLGFFPYHTGRPATPPRLVAGLCHLQHAFALVTRGSRGPLGGEPVLAAFLRGDILSSLASCPSSSSEAGVQCVNAHAGICAGGQAQACSLPRSAIVAVNKGAATYSESSH